MKKKIMAALLCGAIMCSLSACRESERVAYNISKEADISTSRAVWKSSTRVRTSRCLS